MLFIHALKYLCLVYSSIYVLIHLHVLASLSVYVLLSLAHSSHPEFMCYLSSSLSVNLFIDLSMYVRTYVCMHVRFTC